MIADKQRFHKQWRSRKTFKKPVKIDNLKILNLQDNDQKNLKQIKRFRKLKWFIEKEKVGHGKEFGLFALDKNAGNTCQEQAKTIQPTAMAILNREDFLKIMKRRNDEHFRVKAQFIRKVPFLQGLSINLATQLAMF